MYKAHQIQLGSSPNSTEKLTKFNWEAHQIQLGSSPNSTATLLPSGISICIQHVFPLNCKASVVQMDIYQQDNKQRMDIYQQEGKQQMKNYKQNSKQQMDYLPKL